jgi:tetraprenyl-beta-curcumene synthase
VFVHAARTYWLDVFPHVRRDFRHWTQRARHIPDPGLRNLALHTITQEQGNLEGAAAFATFAPPARRALVIRASVAFTAAYDYLDALTEQPAEDPEANTRQLHQALTAAVDPTLAHDDFYAHCPTQGDGGYLSELVRSCQAALDALPSAAAVSTAATETTRSMTHHQVLKHSREGWVEGALADLPVSSVLAPLKWWEAAAAAGSSLPVLALIALAARDHVQPADVAALQRAYYWISALHLLLDDLIDREKDEAEHRHNMVAHYATPGEAAQRLGLIASRAIEAARELPHGEEHALILAGMTSYYLSAPEAAHPHARAAASAVLEAIGPLAKLTMLVFRIRRALARDSTLGRSASGSRSDRLSLMSRTNRQRLR